jgi:hypothetical protein
MIPPSSSVPAILAKWRQCFIIFSTPTRPSLSTYKEIYMISKNIPGTASNQQYFYHIQRQTWPENRQVVQAETKSGFAEGFVCRHQALRDAPH